MTPPHFTQAKRCQNVLASYAVSTIKINFLKLSAHSARGTTSRRGQYCMPTHAKHEGTPGLLCNKPHPKWQGCSMCAPHQRYKECRRGHRQHVRVVLCAATHTSGEQPLRTCAEPAVVCLSACIYLAMRDHSTQMALDWKHECLNAFSAATL